MTTTVLPIRSLAIRMRPLAACLAAICATSVATAAPPQLRAPPVEMPAAPADIAVTTCDDNGPGSLRDAVNQAATGDTIDLTGLTCSRITLTTGAIAIGQGQLAFEGPGRDALTIDAAGSPGYSAFYHVGGGTLIFENMTIESGSKYRTDHDAHGGCIYSNGNVLMRHVTVQNCLSRSIDAYHSLGGAIFTMGETYLADSRITGSMAYSRNSYASGGGVYALGGFQSSQSQISGNAAYSPSIVNTWGGGVFARGSSLIVGTEISNNYAVNMGGAALADNNDLPATMINSTVSGNRAIKIGGVYSRAAMHMYSSTVAFNSSQIWNDGAGNYFAAGLQLGTSAYMESSILSNNVVPGVGTPGDIFDLSGVANTGVAGNNNIVMEFNIGTPTDTIHDDPLLGPLQDNGGTTHTHRPGGASWAINSGNNVLSLQFDQRGSNFPRVAAGGSPDIGAYETDFDVIFVNGFN